MYLPHLLLLLSFYRCALNSRTPVATERRMDLQLHLQCSSPLLPQLQHTVSFLHLFLCAFLLQLSITGTHSLIFVDSLPFPQIWSVKFYCCTCSTSSSPNSSTICLSSCHDHCCPTARAARQQPCLSGEVSPHFVLTYHWYAHNNKSVNISLYHCVIALPLHTDLCGSISAAACWPSLPCTNCPIHG